MVRLWICFICFCSSDSSKTLDWISPSSTRSLRPRLSDLFKIFGGNDVDVDDDGSSRARHKLFSHVQSKLKAKKSYFISILQLRQISVYVMVSSSDNIYPALKKYFISS